MTTPSSPVRLILGYDGSPQAGAAIEAGAALFPGAEALITHLWTPPFASESLRRRLWTGTRHVDEFVAAVEREGEREADRLAAAGATLARAAGWAAEPLVRRSYGGEGVQFAQLAEELDVDLIVLGSRGLGGAKAVLGSVSDMAVHYALHPVLVVPHPLLESEAAALADGPVLVGWDGSAGATHAWHAARRLFPARKLILACVDGAGEDPVDESGGKPAVVHVGSGHGEPTRAVADALTRCSRTQAAAAIAVGSRGRSALSEILLGSVAMATLHRAYRPVLVVPADAVSPV